MAASVQELIAAAQTKKSPFISLLEGGLQGFQESAAQEPTRRRAQKKEDRGDLTFQQSQEDRIQALEQAKRIRRRKEAEDKKAQAVLNGKTEEGLARRIREAGGATGSLPRQKHDVSVAFDAQGFAKRSVKPSTKTAPRSRLLIGITKGEEALDRAFAKDFNEFLATGGFADVEKKLEQLREVSDALRTEDNITGPLVGTGTGTFLQGLQTRFNPRGTAIREAVEEVVQRNLKAILGGQFTEREGEKLIARAYNPLLQEKENLKRVQRLIDQINLAAAAKLEASKYFEDNGTLRGFKGTQYVVHDGKIIPISQLDRVSSKRSTFADELPNPKVRIIRIRRKN